MKKDDFGPAPQPPALFVFNAARHGHYFRTRAMINTATGAREWLYAVQEPHTQLCVLMKVREHEGRDFPERIRLRGNVPFPAVLAQMVRFEDSSANPSFLQADAEEERKLGLDHFNAFALREGLIRDRISGDFRAASGGYIVSSGLYDEKDARALGDFAAAEKPAPDFKLSGPPAVIQSIAISTDPAQWDKNGIYNLARIHNDLLALSDYYRHDNDIDELDGPGQYVASHRWEDRLCLGYCELQDEIALFQPTQTRRRGKLHTAAAVIGAGMRKFWHLPVALAATSFPHFLFIRQSAQLDHLPDQRKILALQRLVFEHSRARNAFLLIDKDGFCEKLEDRLERVESIARDLGFDDGTLCAIRNAVYSGEPLPYAQELRDYTASLWKAYRIAEETERKSLPAAPQP